MSKKQSMSQLDQLKKVTKVVADTGDFNSLKQYQPEDATTNPSLIFKAAQMDAYQGLVKEAVSYGKENAKDKDDVMPLIIDRLAVNFGLEILKIVPGYVSTEVDARLSFDTEGSIARARRIIKMYEDAGINRSRILIKLATTWECVEAAKVLQAEGISCNMTLLFSLSQAVIAAEAGATLVSPFVGRIFDWYKKENNVDSYPKEEDPGVLSVTEIYNYYKKHNYDTIVMGASFRNIGEIQQLAGCDRLTISPGLLEELSKNKEELPRILGPKSKGEVADKISYDEKSFRLALNDNIMATTKLAEGINGFAKDLVKLEKIIEKML